MSNTIFGKMLERAGIMNESSETWEVMKLSTFLEEGSPFGEDDTEIPLSFKSVILDILDVPEKDVVVCSTVLAEDNDKDFSREMEKLLRRKSLIKIPGAAYEDMTYSIVEVKGYKVVTAGTHDQDMYDIFFTKNLLKELQKDYRIEVK